MLDDGQAQAGAFDAPMAGAVDTIKTLGDEWQVLGLDADAFVSHRKHCIALTASAPADANGLALRGVAHGVDQQIGKRTVQLHRTALEPDGFAGGERNVMLRFVLAHGFINDATHQGRHIDRLNLLRRLLLGLQARQLQQITDQTGHALDLLEHFTDGLIPTGIDLWRLGQGLQIAGQHRQWGAQLV